MTNKFDDGGPAYPTTIENQPGEHGRKGMSLRDYFAAKAMQGYLGNPWQAEQMDGMDESFSEQTAILAEASYKMADAMIAERNKRRGEG